MYSIVLHIYVHTVLYIHVVTPTNHPLVLDTVGISTDTLWKERYLQRWHRVGRSPRRADYKKINDLKEECAEECDSWRAAYLQRHLQVLINERQSVTEGTVHVLYTCVWTIAPNWLDKVLCRRAAQ